MNTANAGNGTPVRLAVVGAGGYAGTITDHVLRAGGASRPPVQLVAVAEPDIATHAQRLAELRQRGVLTVPGLDALLADVGFDAVWLPLPIPLHRPFTERALLAGKAVMVEKPAAGTVQDVDAMIAARDQARLPVAVGFQHMYDPLTMEIKKRLIGGCLGTIRHITLHACWARTEQYYRRSAWAGRFRQKDAWVMDSPANNALAHYVNLSLFLAGQTLPGSAVPEEVESELYRAHAIENFDTISLRARLAGGSSLLALLTHACRESFGPIIRIEGTKGHLVWTSAGVEIETVAGHEKIAASADMGLNVIEHFARLVRGIPDETRLGSTLETARAQVLVVNAASEASAIAPVPATQIQRSESQEGNWVSIIGIEGIIRHCAEHRQMLHESGLLPFTRPAGTLDVRQYRQFAGPRMQ